MTKSSEAVTLYGERAERFREIQEDITERLGYEPSNAETAGIIMSQWSLDSKSILSKT